MRKLPGEKKRQVGVLQGGRPTVLIESKVIYGESDGDTVEEAQRAAEAAYERKRRETFAAQGEALAEDVLLDAVADATRLATLAACYGGRVPEGTPLWYELETRVQDMHRTKAAHYLEMHTAERAATPVRGVDRSLLGQGQARA